MVALASQSQVSTLSSTVAIVVGGKICLDIKASENSSMPSFHELTKKYHRTILILIKII